MSLPTGILFKCNCYYRKNDDGNVIHLSLCDQHIQRLTNMSMNEIVKWINGQEDTQRYDGQKKEK